MHHDGAIPARRRSAVLLALAGAAILVLGQAGLWLGVEPIATWSYDLSWWSAILLADAVVHLRTGSSMMLSRPRGFLGLAIASGAYWLLYECANFRLRNWYYVGVPPDLFTRTLGVYFAFATVLPGVLEIDALITSFAGRASPSRPARPPGTPLRATSLALGTACLVLPLLFPRHAYAIVWGAAFLLLEPWLAPRDELSILARLRAGDAGPLLRILAAGAVTGAMWECWNWRSPAKWIYTVPMFEEGKLFEMPYLGFVGFIPFALGCHSVARALVVARVVPEWDPAAGTRRTVARGRALGAGLAALLFSAAAIAGVNRFTIHSTRPVLADVPGIPETVERRLESAGVRSLEDLLASAAPDLEGPWVETARLMTVRGMGRRGVDWLAGANVTTTAELAVRDPVELQREVVTRGHGALPLPTIAEVRVWVIGARAMLRDAR